MSVRKELLMDVLSAIIRALDSFQGDVEAGVIEVEVDIDDIRAARVWARTSYERFWVVDSTLSGSEAVLGRFADEQEAAGFIETLPDYESGRYGLDDMLLGAIESGFDRTRTGMPVSNVPAVIEILDRLDEIFRTDGLDSAHHHIRAVAHDMGWHLSSCLGGRRQAPEGPNW